MYSLYFKYMFIYWLLIKLFSDYLINHVLELFKNIETKKIRHEENFGIKI